MVVVRWQPSIFTAGLAAFYFAQISLPEAFQSHPIGVARQNLGPKGRIFMAVSLALLQPKPITHELQRGAKAVWRDPVRCAFHDMG